MKLEVKTQEFAVRIMSLRYKQVTTAVLKRYEWQVRQLNVDAFAREELLKKLESLKTIYGSGEGLKAKQRRVGH